MAVTMVCVFVHETGHAAGLRLDWAAAFGGGSVTEVRAVGLDAAGNVYAAGHFQGTADFDPGPGNWELTATGGGHAFISKLDPSGNLVWARAIGEGDFLSDRVACNAIFVDGAGNAYLTGSFRGDMDFNPRGVKSRLISAGGENAFVAKLSPDGALVWAKALGAGATTVGQGITVDGGSVITTGWFIGTGDFDPSDGEDFQLDSGPRGMFVSRLDSTGEFEWARRMRGATQLQDEVSGLGVAVDAAGSIYLTGSFRGTIDFDPEDESSFPMTAPGASSDGFVASLTGSGDFQWARAVTGTSFVVSNSIAVDEASVYTAGWFQGSAGLAKGMAAPKLESAGGRDAFVVKLDTGGGLQWEVALGGTGHDEAAGVALDGAGNVIVTGLANRPSSSSRSDIFVTVLDSDGNLVRDALLTSTGNSVGNAAAGAGGTVFVGGGMRSTVDFDPGPASFTLTAAPSSTFGFVTRLSPGAPRLPGDVNGDGMTDAVDVQLAINAALGLAIDPDFVADINGDGLVNAIDVQLVINAALGLPVIP